MADSTVPSRIVEATYILDRPLPLAFEDLLRPRGFAVPIPRSVGIECLANYCLASPPKPYRWMRAHSSRPRLLRMIPKRMIHVVFNVPDLFNELLGFILIHQFLTN